MTFWFSRGNRFLAILIVVLFCTSNISLEAASVPMSEEQESLIPVVAFNGKNESVQEAVPTPQVAPLEINSDNFLSQVVPLGPDSVKGTRYVNDEGEIYVVDADTLYKLDKNGNPVEEHRPGEWRLWNHMTGMPFTPETFKGWIYEDHLVYLKDPPPPGTLTTEPQQFSLYLRKIQHDKILPGTEPESEPAPKVEDVQKSETSVRRRKDFFSPAHLFAESRTQQGQLKRKNKRKNPKKSSLVLPSFS